MNEITSTAEIINFSKSDNQFSAPPKQPFVISKELDDYVLSFNQSLLFENEKIFYAIDIQVKSRLKSNAIPTENTFFNLYGLGVSKAREKANEKWQGLGFISVIDWELPTLEDVKPDIHKAIEALAKSTLS